MIEAPPWVGKQSRGAQERLRSFSTASCSTSLAMMEMRARSGVSRSTRPEMAAAKWGHVSADRQVALIGCRLHGGAIRTWVVVFHGVAGIENVLWRVVAQGVGQANASGGGRARVHEAEGDLLQLPQLVEDPLLRTCSGSGPA